MFQPSIVGQVICIDSENREFVDKDTGKVRKYVQRGIDLLVTEPERGTARVTLFSDNDALPVPEFLVPDAKVNIRLQSFQIKGNVGMLRARLEDVRPVTKK